MIRTKQFVVPGGRLWWSTAVAAARLSATVIALGLWLGVWGPSAWAAPEEGAAEVSDDAQIKAADEDHHAGEKGDAAAHGREHGHDDHGHHEHIGGKEVHGNPAEFKIDLAIFTLIIFVLLFLILSKFAWKPIAAALDQREQSIAANIAAAHKANDDAKAMLAQYEMKLAAAQGEVKAILDEARRDAEHTQAEILAKARADAQAEKDRALRDIETATDQALKQLAEQSANFSVGLAGKILGQQVKAADHTRLIEDALKSFPSN